MVWDEEGRQWQTRTSRWVSGESERVRRMIRLRTEVRRASKVEWCLGLHLREFGGMVAGVVKAAARAREGLL